MLLETYLGDEEIEDIPKHTWKKYARNKGKEFALIILVVENNKQEKSKSVYFSELRLCEYLEKNQILPCLNIYSM